MGLFTCAPADIQPHGSPNKRKGVKEKRQMEKEAEIKNLYMSQKLQEKKDCASWSVFKFTDKNLMCCLGKDAVPACKLSQSWD